MDSRTFVRSLGMTDVRTHPYHPQSNGRDERLHRTLREELPLDDDATFYQAQEVIDHFTCVRMATIAVTRPLD